MFGTKKAVQSVVFAVALASPLMFSGCADEVGIGVGYRVYDPYRADYHVWDANEGGYYNQWVIETHRDPHRDFRKLKREISRNTGGGATTIPIAADAEALRAFGR